MDAAIANAIDQIRAYAGLPRLVGMEGCVVSDAYWAAKEAEHRLAPFIDERFRQLAQSWYWEDEDGPKTLSTRVRSYEHAARFAWWATRLVQHAVAGQLAMDDYRVETAILAAQAEAEVAGVTRDEAAYVERVSQFFAIAGHLPRPDERDLYDAFEAALMADETEFARHLAAHGWGQVE